MRYCPLVKEMLSESECGNCEMCPDQQLDPPCPNCKDGTLELLTARELVAVGLDVGLQVYGCDECQYMEDKDGARIYKK